MIEFSLSQLEHLYPKCIFGVFTLEELGIFEKIAVLEKDQVFQSGFHNILVT